MTRTHYFPAALWLVCTALLPAQNRTYSVAGVVVTSAGGTPLKHVRISLWPPAQNGPELDSTITHEDGRFRFNVPEGKYDLIAERDGLPRQIYGLQSLGAGFGTAIVTGPSQQTDNLIFKLFSGAAITGKVTDESGEPVENALLQLLRSSVVAGNRQLVPAGFQHTDDLGQYRFGRLASGEYYLVVTAVPWYADSLSIGAPGSDKTTDSTGTAYAPVFYPNANSPSSAAPLKITDGEQAVADFSLSAVAGSSVIITVADSSGSPDASPITGQLYLSMQGPKGIDAYQSVVNYLNGPTSIRGVPEGRYTLRLTGVKDGIRIDDSQTINVTGGSTEVTLLLKNSLQVAGKLQSDTGTSLKIAHPVLVLRDVESIRGFGAPVASDGTFQFRAVEPGKYNLILVNRDYYIKRVLVDGQEPRDEVIDLSGESAPHLTVLASDDGGRLKGYVYCKGRVLPGLLVVLAPQSESGSRLDYQAFQTDSDGSFDFQNVRPGEYLLFASTQIELEYRNRKLIRPLLANAKRLSITPRLIATTEIQIP